MDTDLMNLADDVLCDMKPSEIIVASLTAGREQIITAFTQALAEAVAEGVVTDAGAMAINERAVEIFAKR